MSDSKQKRKTPLTTIAISQEYAQKLDSYLKEKGINRKEFVELSCEYFIRTGFDIRGEVFDLSPLEKVSNRIENSISTVIEQSNNNTQVIHQLLQMFKEQSAKELPAPEIIVKATQERVQSENRVIELEKELELLREQNKALMLWKDKAYQELCRVRDQQKVIGRISVNTIL